MTDLIDHIDAAIAECNDLLIKNFGLCHLVSDNNAVYPSTYKEDAVKVAPDDNYPILTYHRLLSGTLEPNEELSFGRKITAKTNQRVRMVVFIDLSRSPSIIDDIINAMPDVFEIEGYRYCNVSKAMDLIRDHAAVWSDEFSEAYQSRFQKRYQVYAVEYTLEYIKCPVCETSP